MNKAEEIKELCKPLSDYLKANHNPHTRIIVTQSNVAIMEDLAGASYEVQD